MKSYSIFVLFFVFILNPLSQTQALGFKIQSNSSENPVLIELFTSQGCSSCPPAEIWMTKKLTHEGLFKTFIPVVYHVDYWNYIGWVDIFSSKTYSNRQRNYAKFLKSRQIATPSFFVNGRPWKQWYLNDPLNATKTDPGKSNPLKSAEIFKNRRIFVFASPSSLKPEYQSQDLTIHIALLTTGVISSITGGENKGKTLKNDFSILHYEQKLLPDNTPGLKKVEFAVPPISLKLRGKKQAIAIWISDHPNGPVLQALASWIPYLY